MSAEGQEALRVADLTSQLREVLPLPPERATWPTVSIIVPTHDGRPLLERMLAGLVQCTDYPAIEVVVVDNASDDGTERWLQAQSLPFPLIVIRNARNVSFSAAINVGAAQAAGELLLLLNNDVEPIEPGWLRRLVTSLEHPGAAVAGAILVDPNRTSISGRPVAVQHDGIAFRLHRGVLRPVLRRIGADLTDVLGPDGQVAAVAAACALMRRRDFAALGGLHTGFRYGGEDIDMCLRLAGRGGVAMISRSTVLLHRPLSTRRGSPDGSRENIRANHRLLLERWGPALKREYALDRTDGQGMWNGDGGAAVSQVSFCVKPATTTTDAQLEGVVAAIELASRPVRIADEGDAWLLDDVVVHMFDGAGRHALAPGRLNALLCTRGRPPAREAAGYDLVLPPEASVSDLLRDVDAAFERAGGPRRIGARPRPRQEAVEAASIQERRAIIVLGMARSGTSAVTRLLNLLGVELGAEDRLLGPMQDINERGFFEHYPIMRLNTALLRRLGGSWRDPPAMPPGWETDPGLADLRDQAAAILHEDFAGVALWGFKDPRTCLTLPFWRALIGPASFVICHRHPLEIAASLERRDRLSTEQSVALWRRYTASAIASTEHDPRVFVAYRDVLEDPAAVCDGLAAFLGRLPGAEDHALWADIEQWVDSGLRHHVRSPLDLIDDPRLDGLDVTLALLLDLTGRRGGPGLEAAQLTAALNEVASRLLEGVQAIPRDTT